MRPRPSGRNARKYPVNDLLAGTSFRSNSFTVFPVATAKNDNLATQLRRP
jgi:hypothetical protein